MCGEVSYGAYIYSISSTISNLVYSAFTDRAVQYNISIHKIHTYTYNIKASKSPMHLYKFASGSSCIPDHHGGSIHTLMAIRIRWPLNNNRNVHIHIFSFIFIRTQRANRTKNKKVNRKREKAKKIYNSLVNEDI